MDAKTLADQIETAISDHRVQGMERFSIHGHREDWKIVVDALRLIPEAAKHEPSIGLLVSIALRFDHGLFMRNEMLGETEEQHGNRIHSALSDARRAWDEIHGEGFWSKERDAEYVAMLEAKNTHVLELFGWLPAKHSRAPQPRNGAE